MNCPQCRSVLPPGAQFCPSCGYRFPAAASPPSPYGHPAAPPPSPYGQPAAPPPSPYGQPAAPPPQPPPGYGASQPPPGYPPVPQPGAYPPQYGDQLGYGQPGAAAPAYGQPEAGYEQQGYGQPTVEQQAYAAQLAPVQPHYGQPLGYAQMLTFGGIVSNALSMGIKNAPSLLGAFLLWLVTCWIPYLNVGTTIGLMTMAAKMGRGGVISPFEIFDASYRRQMGEFFLVMAFVSMGVFIGAIFFWIPGIIIAIAWCLAPLLVVDKGLNPTDAIQQSNDLTYGKKGVIFLGGFVIWLVMFVAVFLLTWVGGLIHEFVASMLFLAGSVVMGAVMLAVLAHVYAVLTAGMSTGTAQPQASA